jgi:hypothetical protein
MVLKSPQSRARNYPLFITVFITIHQNGSTPLEWGAFPIYRKQNLKAGGPGRSRTADQRFRKTQEGSEPFGKSCALLLFSMGYKSIDVIRSAWK